MSAQMEIREKDKALAGVCRAAATAAVDAIDWLGTNEDIVGPRMHGLQKSMRKYAVDARRYAVAAERPMSVGVFGASQAGKSFLIGKLITPPGDPVKVVFGEGDSAVKLDFLTQVNPEGGDETTGLVTRFTIQQNKTPEGYPVTLRVLREIDVIKILANAFVYDLSGDYKVDDPNNPGTTLNRSPTSERLQELFAGLQPRVAPSAVDALVVEDVYELRDYVEKTLKGHLLGEDAGEHYWPFLEDSLPNLAPEDRALALAPLWGELEEFTDLYLRLKKALVQLDHSAYMYAPMSAIEDRGHGVLHVRTLYDLDDPASSEKVMVVSASGSSAQLDKCVVTALTAEMCVTLEKAPWEFFAHTDLLDFPGARSREAQTADKFLRASGNEGARSHCFLRGKVAVLFDNYAADLDLNAMMLCVGPENQEVKTLPGLVDDWIARTHGRQSSDRQGMRTALFFCMTKSDILFQEKAGSEDPDARISTRMSNNLGPYGSWAEDWMPGQAFDNSFFIRNPGIRDDGLFTYDETSDSEVPLETGWTDRFQESLVRFREQFLRNEKVVKHLAKPEEKLDALLALNDGGSTYLAECLAPVCDPDLKYDQVKPGLDKVLHQIELDLKEFHESGDIETRVKERLKAVSGVQKALKSRPTLIALFIRLLQIDESVIAATYLEYARRAAEVETNELDIDIDLDLDFDDDDVEADAPADEEVENNNQGFGYLVLERWATNLEDKAKDEKVTATFGLNVDQLSAFVRELSVAAERFELAKEIDSMVLKSGASRQRSDEVANQIAMRVAVLVNDLVNYLGRKHPEVESELFRPLPVTDMGALPDLPNDPAALKPIRTAFMVDWLKAVSEMTRENASWGQGGLIDVEQNARLGKILQSIQVTL